ncbi:MAG: hypothetical protein ACRCU2_00120 [Planktothrix sp.]
MGILAFIFLGISCIELLIIMRLSIRNQELKSFLKRYGERMEMLIIINRDLQEKLDELRKQ